MAVVSKTCQVFITCIFHGAFIVFLCVFLVCVLLFSGFLSVSAGRSGMIRLRCDSGFV